MPTKHCIRKRELKKDFPKPFLEKINPFAKKPSCVTSLWITFGTDLLNPEPSSKKFKSWPAVLEVV